MRKVLIITACLLTAVSANAQETYDNANIATQDLNGTARYVGMGGAMDALGADISTISSNPAGIGLFRSSTASASFGFTAQQDAKTFADADKVNMSFDQIGFVYAKRTGSKSFLNLAFNYHKSRNFNQILSAADRLKGASQNKLSYMKGYEGLFDIHQSNNGDYVANSNTFNQVDYLYYNVLMPEIDENGQATFYYNDAAEYLFNRSTSGYIGEYDFNISGNINDRVYLGLTFGIHDVNYKGYSEYSEILINGSDNVGDVVLTDERRIDGAGFDLKAGVIFRPLENNPLRIGLSVATPIWYDLTSTNYTVLNNYTKVGLYEKASISESYDFKLYTPWRFGLSVGTTFGKNIAIGAGYEFADYGSLDSRINDGGYYDWYWDDYYETSSSDKEMNRHAERTLKGVSTFKIGAEYKPISELAFRLGYNYVSAMYDEDGYKDVSLDSPGTYYTSSTDYTNWDATHRLTLGVGYTLGKFQMDAAYQYSAQKGDFSPFTNYYAADASSSDNNICNPKSVENNRHQLLVTLGYRF
ncbi:MAG: hemin receptor [Prevotella sp.]|nr:hemin receptor [Prevotella sp.]MBO5314347.1 hemin receptor [Prevotella sp.]